jgi:vacuolar protein sorting-associated protein 26
MTSFFSFASSPVEVEIKLTGEDQRKQVEVKEEKGQKVMCPVYYDGESVTGQVGYLDAHVIKDADVVRSMCG